MPNWCDTTYTVRGEKEQVKKFYDLAMNSWSKPKEENKGWLGHIIEDLGENTDEIMCRGWIQWEPELSEDGSECVIRCDTAWNEAWEWREFVEKHIKDIKIYYLAIEPGMELYYSNDSAFIGSYYVDNANDIADIFNEYEAIKYINGFFNKKFKTIKECLVFANEYEENGDPILWIHQIEPE